MQIAANTIVVFPSTPLPLLMNPYHSSEHQIDFVRYLDPFVRLLMDQCVFLFKISCFIANCGLKILSDAAVVFSRLLISPDFDPFKKEFEEKIELFIQAIPSLKEEVSLLEKMFWQELSISRDLKCFEEINSKIMDNFNQLERFVHLLGQYTPYPPIYEKVLEAKNSYELLDNQINCYFARRASSVIEKFENVLKPFMTGMPLLEEIQQELSRNFNILDKMIKPRLLRLDKSELNTQMSESLLKRINILREYVQQLNSGSLSSKSTLMSAGFAEPLRLRNIGNSCYLDSVLQALFCVDQIRAQLQPLLPLEDDEANSSPPLISENPPTEIYAKKLAIQKELLKFISDKQVNLEGPLSQMEFILALLIGRENPSIHRLRDAIFKSGLHYEFKVDDLEKQLDAASIMELFIEHFLPNCKFTWQEHTSAPEFPGIEFVGHVATMTILPVSLCKKPENQSLEVMLQRLLLKHYEAEEDVRNQRSFDVKNDAYKIKVLNQQVAYAYENSPPQKVRQYVQWHRFIELPPILTLQFKRFKGLADGIMIKDNAPVHLPENGIIDLTEYCDVPEGAQQKARYKIKSGVVHTGSLNSGHYVSYVEIKEKYYYCNDLDRSCYKEISKKEFLGRTDFYLLVLERLPDTDADPLPPIAQTQINI
jgi:hypothetical protein